MKTGARRNFIRETPEQRRDDLIAATLEIIAQSGIQAATVRAIASEAGVTLGLIRHYFDTKEELIAAAFGRHMSAMTEEARAAAPPGIGPPVHRLAAFIRAILNPPVVSSRSVALWAAFMQTVQHDGTMEDVHIRTYNDYRQFVGDLISDALREAGKPADAATVRTHAIACNALLDGLWVEACTIPASSGAGDLEQVALTSVSRILDMHELAAVP